MRIRTDGAEGVMGGMEVVCRVWCCLAWLMIVGPVYKLLSHRLLNLLCLLWWCACLLRVFFFFWFFGDAFS